MTLAPNPGLTWILYGLSTDPMDSQSATSHPSQNFNVSRYCMFKFFLHLTLTLIIATSNTTLRAKEPQVGERAHSYLAAHFATGYWAEKADPFTCPVVGEVTETKIAIYVKEANRNTMHLATALDKVVREYPQLKRSFFLVSEEHRESPMTDEELKTSLDRLKEAGKEHGIEKVSLGCLKYDKVVTRWRNSLGFFDSGDAVICVIEPSIVPATQQNNQRNRLPVRTIKPAYRFVSLLNSKDIDEQTAASAVKKALSSLSE